MSKRVYPVEGRFLIDVPHVEHDCDDKRCLASGAFTDKPPGQTSTRKRRTKKATGGPVSGPAPVLVGESGPELIQTAEDKES
jgi:hypothetical protein